MPGPPDPILRTLPVRGESVSAADLQRLAQYAAEARLGSIGGTASTPGDFATVDPHSTEYTGNGFWVVVTGRDASTFPYRHAWSEVIEPDLSQTVTGGGAFVVKGEGASGTTSDVPLMASSGRLIPVGAVVYARWADAGNYVVVFYEPGVVQGTDPDDPVTDPPTNPTEGDIYYFDGILYIFINNEWITLCPCGGPSPSPSPPPSGGGPDACGPADINYFRHLHCGEDQNSPWRRWYTSEFWGRPTLSGQGLTQDLSLMPFISPKRTRYGKIACYVDSAGGSGETRLGIYRAADPSNNDLYPLVLVVDAGTIDHSTTGRKELSIDVELAPCELYYLAIKSTSSAGFTSASALDFYPVFGMDGLFATFSGALVSDDEPAGAFSDPYDYPATKLAQTLDYIPIVALQIKCPFTIGDCFCDFGTEGNAAPTELAIDVTTLSGDGDCDCLEALGDTLGQSPGSTGWSGSLAAVCGMGTLFLDVYCSGDGIDDWRLDWILDNDATYPACATHPLRQGTARVLTDAPFAPSCSPFSMYFEVTVPDACCNGNSTATTTTTKFRFHFTEF